MKIKYETERLIVREWKDKDYKDLFEYASNKEVTKFLHFKIYESEEDAKTRIATLKENYKTENRYGEFAVEIKSEKKVIGSVNLGLDTIKAGGIVTLGYTLNPKYQRKGYMTVRQMYYTFILNVCQSIYLFLLYNEIILFKMNNLYLNT